MQRLLYSTVQYRYIVVDPDPGSESFLTPGSGIENSFFPDLGSWIKPIFLRALWQFFG
jgi:hypothetical protein